MSSSPSRETPDDRAGEVELSAAIEHVEGIQENSEGSMVVLDDDGDTSSDFNEEPKQPSICPISMPAAMNQALEQGKSDGNGYQLPGASSLIGSAVNREIELQLTREASALEGGFTRGAREKGQ